MDLWCAFFIKFGLLINIWCIFSECTAWSGDYDYIIVGGGTAGCVLANRLSENPNVSVLVLEAGMMPTDPFIPSTRTFLDNMLNEDENWGFTNEPQKFTGPDVRLPVRQAKRMGGSSTHNGGFYIRGSKHDFNNWAKRSGYRNWNYKNVLQFFEKSEDMADKDLANNGFHGTGGPLKTTISYTDEITDDIIKSAVEAGLKNLSDYNGPDMEGIGKLQSMVDKNGKRSSVFDAFLKPILARRNLHVKEDGRVTKIAFEKKPVKATGVWVMVYGKEKFIQALKEVIVCAGAINSPKILMLSGIGPEKHLRNKGIEPIVNLPVGENLQDHMMGTVRLRIDDSTPVKRRNLFTVEALFEYIFTGNGPWSTLSSVALAFSKTPNQPKDHSFPHIEQVFELPLLKLDPELVASIRNGSGIIPEKLRNHVLQESQDGPRYIDVFTLILHSKSRGTVKLKSHNWMEDPIIDYPYFDNKDDLKDFINSIKIIKKVLKSETMQKAGVSIEGPHPSCTTLKFDTDKYWECHLKYNLDSSHNNIGTCKMAKDKSGVVDNKLKVKGVKRLRVIDSSIMPYHISGHTSAAVIMIAEKGADIIKATWPKNE